MMASPNIAGVNQTFDGDMTGSLPLAFMPKDVGVYMDQFFGVL
jgi:hypothetical protein